MTVESLVPQPNLLREMQIRAETQNELSQEEIVRCGEYLIQRVKDAYFKPWKAPSGVELNHSGGTYLKYGPSSLEIRFNDNGDSWDPNFADGKYERKLVTEKTNRPDLFPPRSVMEATMVCDDPDIKPSPSRKPFTGAKAFIALDKVLDGILPKD